jgi:diguanylate cyclase (GGDEF)-like protein
MCRGLAVRDNDKIPYRMVGSQTDISDRKRAEEKLVFDAVHDALTGLPNRVLFLDRLDHCIERSSRRQNYSFAVLYLDLNRFKIINDSLGHLLGDQLLIEIGSRIKSVIRKGDTLSRLGGDEFVILCEDILNINVATNLAERIHQILEIPVDLNGQNVVVSCSIGITESSIGYDRPEDMLRDADTAMYRAKASNTSRHEIFDQTMHEKAMNILQVESDLRLGLERGEFDLYYQPIVELSKEVVSGFEALLRWNHPKLGLLLPDKFLEVAIESRLIVPLGRWALAQACRQMQVWKKKWDEARDWTISVNLSAPELAQPDLVPALTGIIEKSGLSPIFLKLEVTENALIENSTHALQTMNALRAAGIHLSIDDFGTGYSSFSYLHEFPFDELKIDRTFISELDNRKDKQQIVNAIVSLAHNLGMTVVAEGSASNAIYENLRDVACEYAQGFSIMAPQPANQIYRSIAVDVDRTDFREFSSN